MSAFLYSQITSPQSMLGAIARSEFSRLLAGGSRSASDDEAYLPGWRDILSARERAFSAHPDLPAHLATKSLLSLLISVERGSLDARAAFESARTSAAEDPQNLVVRTAHAVIIDLVNTRGSDETSDPVASSPLARYEALRSVIEATPRARYASLHNLALRQAWHKVMQRYIRRPDVAVTIAAEIPEEWLGDRRYFIDEHYAALPVIHHRLLDLAERLRAEQQPQAADACVRWLGDLHLGLIDSEPDAGTRLLCAELLAEALGPASVAGRGLEQLREEFLAAAARAPIDLCDQPSYHGPTLAPDAYNAAFRSLVGACVFFLSSIGAAGLLVATGAAGIVRAIFRRKRGAEKPGGSTARPGGSTARRPGGNTAFTEGGSEIAFTEGGSKTAFREGGSETAFTKGGSDRDATPRRLPLYAKIAVAVLPALVAALLLVANLSTYGLRAQGWGVLCAAAVGVAGALAAAVLAGLSIVPDRRSQRWRLLGTVVLALLAIAVTAVPAPAATSAYRAVDLAAGAWRLLIVAALGVLAAAMLLTPARWRTLARAAVFVWFLNVVVALVVFQFHRAADRHYQQTVVAGRLDEVTARLGPGWQEKYLEPARQALGAARE